MDEVSVCVLFFLTLVFHVSAFSFRTSAELIFFSFVLYATAFSLPQSPLSSLPLSIFPSIFPFAQVDGMGGNEDRGGVQELIAVIKKARVPIVCICNERQHVKIRSLANYCFDLRLRRPVKTQIAKRAVQCVSSVVHRGES